MLTDSFGRLHNYLRISLTDNCNLRCSYCMPDEQYDFAAPQALMQPQEIAFLAKIFVNAGVNKIRLTGGEPLIRKDAAIIIEQLAQLPVSLHITTNATRLHLFFDVLEKAGCKHLNISLDTLNAETFFLLTKRNQFAVVYQNLLTALEKGFKVKLNVVVMKQVNFHELPAFIQLTKHWPLEVRFIEFMPFTGNGWHQQQVATLQEIIDSLSAHFAIEAMPHIPNETAKQFKVANFKGSFAIISTMSMPFCGDCNRLRLTADGKLKNCLFSKEETDLLSALRKGLPVIPLIEQAIQTKAAALGGQFSAVLSAVSPENIYNRSMIRIGG
ncbi:MAG: GTP 3',8-cyclase MoaA [Chitinophagaceae bacterium]